MSEYEDLIRALRERAPEKRRRILRSEAAEAIEVLEMRLEWQQKLHELAFRKMKAAEALLRKAMKDMSTIANKHDTCAVCRNAIPDGICQAADYNCAKCDRKDCICDKCTWEPQFVWRYAGGLGDEQ